ncbi:hypothetical protein BCV70DRAFT_163808 [Testicularia cyperi]|uniref:UBC core domain-containing protein n=1 Tax=Testicularia cyperi TaxID=1882483 RepID=A0A317XNM9_9BASI|nr:hypothetical protein BCV70DRAFT_163808 [Testicularia cyperi]
MIAPATIKRLTKELITLEANPPDGIRVSLDESDMLNFSGWIQGPPGTPYSEGHFQISFDFDSVDFPSAPPTCKFLTPIFHPNVSRAGDICVSTLQKDWKPEYGIARILVTIKCLLIAPNPDSALDPEASRLLQEDYQAYSETAQMWTSIHANRRPALFLTHPAAKSCSQNALPLPSRHAGSAPKQTTKSAIPSISPAAAAAKKVATSGPKRGLRRL